MKEENLQALAEMKKNGVDPELIASAKARFLEEEKNEKDQLEDVDSGKPEGTATEDVDVVPENTNVVSENGNTESTSEDGSSESLNNDDIKTKGDEELKDFVPEPAVLVFHFEPWWERGDKKYDDARIDGRKNLKEVKKLAYQNGYGDDYTKFLKDKGGVARYEENVVLDDINVTPLYRDNVDRADELFNEKLDDIFKVHEDVYIKSGNKVHRGVYDVGEGGKFTRSGNEYLKDNAFNPLTDLENVTFPDGRHRGVRRKRINSKGNQAITSIEMKQAAIEIMRTLEKEDEYIGGTGEGSFNYKTEQKVMPEMVMWAIEFQMGMDWDDPNATDFFDKAVQNKLNQLWNRERNTDERYIHTYSTIDGIVQSKFEELIINKSIEEEKSFLIPDNIEGSDFTEALYQFGKYQLPKSHIDSKVGSDGKQMGLIVNQLKKHDGLKSDTKGYIKYGDNHTSVTFYTHAEAHKRGSLVLVGNPKATTWGETQVILENQLATYGKAIMKNLAESAEYQEKLSLLGTPEILDENWNWDLDVDGYQKIIGTQLGQMVLGALTFGGSTFIQELGGMTSESVSLNAALLHSKIDIVKFKKADAEGTITDKQKLKIQKDFYNLSQDEQHKLSMKVLEGGMIDWDEMYTAAGRSAGLDLVGNFFVISKATKLVPKQLLNGFMQKNLKMFYAPVKTVGKQAGWGTFGEMLTESLQNLNSQAAVGANSPLHTFDSRGLVLETLTAAVVPGPLVIAGQSAQVMVQAIKSTNMDVKKGDFNAWFELAQRKVNGAFKNGDLDPDAHIKATETIELARAALEHINLKDVKNAEQRETITNSLIKSIGYDVEIKKLEQNLKDTKGWDKTYETELTEEINVLTKKRDKERLVQVKNKAISHYLTNAKRQAHWQNQQKEGENANRNTIIFKTTKEAEAYVLKNFPSQIGKFKSLLEEGSYGSNTGDIQMADGSTVSYNFAITDNVIKGIQSGDLTAGNVINHEQAHDNLSNFSEEELSQIRIQVTTEMAGSTDPEIKKVMQIMNRKLEQYDNPSHQEFYTVMSDAFHALDMVNLSLDGKSTLSLLGEVYSDSFSENIGPIVNWKEGFDKMGVLDFIKSYTKRSTGDFYATDVIEDIRGGKEPNIEGLKKNGDGIHVQDSRRVYPTGRDAQEIKQANIVLAEEMLKEKTSPSYVNEADPALQARIRADQKKKLDGELVANNMGLINLFLKHKGNGGLYFDPSAGDVNYTDFSEAVMGEVGTIINSYDPSKGDFGMYLGGLMDKRIPGIWQKLIGDRDMPAPDPDRRQNDVADSSYDDFVNDFDDEVITINGEDVTEKQATSEMRKTLGIKEGDPLYNEILDDTIEVLITDFAALNEKGFYLDTKDKIAKKLFKKLKIELGSPGSKKYITWLNDNVERLYKLLPQSVFNKSYEQFTVEGRRASVALSNDKDLENKSGVKIFSETAGNVIRTKVPYTDEVGIQFIENLLNPDKGRPASKQDALITQLGGVIGIDAISTAINSSAFKDAHGDQDAIMGHVADIINRDMSVQFSENINGKQITYEIKDPKQFQDATSLMRALSLSGIVGDQESMDFVYDMAKKLKYGEDVAGFVVHLDSLKIIEKGDATKFKSDLGKFLEENYPDMAVEFKADGSIVGKKEVLDKIAKDVEAFTGGMDPEMLDAIGFDIFAFHRRALNAAETQHGPKREDGSKIQIQNKKNPDGNQSYANSTTSLKLEGWTFNPKTNNFFNAKGEISADPVKEFGAKKVAAPYFETLQNIKITNEAKKGDPNYAPTNKYSNVRIHNVGVPGGLFGKIAKILNDKTIVAKDGKTAREIRIELITSKYGAEIEASNIANTELATDISVQLIEAVKDGKMSATTFFHLLQSQTNLAYGFRGLTKLSMISVLEGTYNEDGGRAYGEHINPNSGKMLELAKIGIRAKNDASYNYLEAVAILFADHDQVLFTSGDAKTIDTSKLLSGPTSTASYDRLKALTPAQRASFVGPNGESYKVMMAKISLRNNTLIETAKKKFESQRKAERTEKKADAVKGIMQKNTADGVVQGASVFDFDGTLEKGGKNIIVATHPKTGKVVKVSSHDFHNEVGALIEGGFEFNFDDFVNVKKSKKGPMFQKLLNQINKYGVDNIHVLTARQPGAALAIQMWLKQNGVNLLPENITGLGILGPDGKPITVTGEHKADWIENNLILNGFNDIYFVDDGKKIVDAVDDMFATYPEGLLVDGGKSVLVDPLVENLQNSLTTDFNDILEVTEGIDAVKVYSKAQSDIQGANAGNFIVDTVYPPSAYDFEMFTYKYMTKGKEGEKQAEFFKQNLFIPYEKAIQEIDKQKQEIRDDYSALVKELPNVTQNLKEKVEGTNYTSEQAIRVYIWSKQGVEIPGISKRDQKALVAAVNADPELIMFADRLSAISQQKEGYVKPTEYWTIENIAFDLTDMTGSAGRAKHLALWKANKDEIFSEENINKLRVLYGEKHVEALQDMLYRMEYGRNKSRPGRIEQEWNQWVNNSVGAVMFFNMRSAALQTISAVNYIDWENNHPGNAALAFANQPQFWKDFSMIYNSDFLKERRSGNTRTINEAELATHLRGKTNKAKAALAWLLEKGFTPTQIADSFAISSGGASYYRNQVKAYENSGMTVKEAEAQAFLDLRDKTEKGQQSSRADNISQQQAGGLGRLILAFKNTPMQYNRIMIKAMADIKNKRGSLKGNLSKVAYYGAVQSVIFSSLQTALFSALGDDDEWDNKTERVANGMIDTLLNGMGLTGAVAATIKNGYLMYKKQKAKGYKADHARTILAFANLSPTIGSKLRKLYGGIQTEAMNEGSIAKMGLTIENPAFSALANVISATTNIPADRVVSKINNIILASSSEQEAMDRIALLMGWNAWDLGIKNTKAKEINKEFKIEKKEKKKIFNERKEEEFIKEQEDKNIVLQKQEEKEGKTVYCAYTTDNGRCKTPVVKGQSRCTIHQVVEQRKSGEKTQCTKVKSNKKRCGVMTANKSGLCYYHD